MTFILHLHLIAAISWIGGSIFLFVLGLTLRKKEDQRAVYPRIGPIYGYFEIAALSILLTTGIFMISEYGFIPDLFDLAIHNSVIDALRIKLWLVGVLSVLTVVHTIISFQTIHVEKTPLQKFFSRGGSLGIFLINFLILHYAMVLRDIL
jgi:uncharacterized membrane protein